MSDDSSFERAGAEPPERRSRRSFLRRAAMWSAGAVSAAAGLAGPFADKAYAVRYVKCCRLPDTPNCPVSYCPSNCRNSRDYEWWCLHSDNVWYKCLECYQCNCSGAYPYPGGPTSVEQGAPEAAATA